LGSPQLVVALSSELDSFLLLGLGRGENDGRDVLGVTRLDLLGPAGLHGRR
jgi:hypothetical protein